MKSAAYSEQINYCILVSGLHSDARGEIVFFQQMSAGNKKTKDGKIHEKYMVKV